MSKVTSEILATIKHLESDISAIVGYGGDAKSTAECAAKKIRELIESLEGHKDEAPAEKPALTTTPKVVEKPAPAAPAAGPAEK